MQGNNGSQSLVNSASRGGRNSGNRGEGRGGGRSQPGGCGRGTGGRGHGPNNAGGKKPRFNGRCQVCLKEGLSADNCWHHFDVDYVTEVRNASTAVHGYGTDSGWYIDNGATNHITSELDKLVIHDKYNGGDQIRTASGACMNIDHIGKAIVSTPNRNLKLNNVLHVPSAKKKSCFCSSSCY
jgi:hypothetical protein